MLNGNIELNKKLHQKFESSLLKLWSFQYMFYNSKLSVAECITYGSAEDLYHCECTACGKAMALPKVTASKSVICPHCNARTIAKSGRKNVTHEKISEHSAYYGYYQDYDKGKLLRVFEVSRNYSNEIGKRGRFVYKELQRYYIDDTEVVCYSRKTKLHYYCYCGGYGSIREDDHDWSPEVVNWNLCSFKVIDEDYILNTCNKYLKEYVSSRYINKPWKAHLSEVYHLVSMMRININLKTLIDYGFIKIAFEEDYNSRGYINCKKNKSISKLLKFDINRLPLSKRVDLSTDSAKRYALLEKEKVPINPVNMAICKELCNYKVRLDPYVKRTNTSLRKIIKCLRNNMAKSNMKVSDYIDYLRQLSELGRDITYSGFALPTNLQQAHDNTANEYINWKDEQEKHRLEKISIGYKELYKSYQPIFGTNNDNYTVLVPSCGEDIKTEGSKLRHCVGSYTDRHLSKSCIILFIRESNNSNKPYYTLEWNPKTKNVVQCRGLSNINYKDNVELSEFVDGWTIRVLKNLRLLNKKKRSA